MSPVETAVRTYIRAAAERDPAERAKLLEACFADDARFVTRSGVLRGRAAIEAMIVRGLDAPFHLASAVDARGTTFRFRTIVTRGDGATLEFFDAGEIGEDGRIQTILVFTGPLPDA